MSTVIRRSTMEIRHAHLFCGLGGGAKGFNAARVSEGSIDLKYRCLGGIDVDPAGLRDFHRAAGVPGTLMDLFDRGQYEAWHGRPPPPDWKEAMPEDVRRAFGGERPHIVFLSPPCKGFSGLLAESKSKEGKYQALNRLTLRGVYLTLEAYRDDPPELILLENVPRIAFRGRWLLDQMTGMLQAFGYAVAETQHDCGELGGLGQTRKRFLLVARHMPKVRPFLYEPPKRPLQSVGSVLEKMPLPDDPAGGPMHRLPRLQWQTWVRLAFVEAGKDWRSLQRLIVEDGVLRDFRLVRDQQGSSSAVEVPPWTSSRTGPMGVTGWDARAATVAGESLPTNGPFAVSDPRYHEAGGDYGQFGVKRWGEPRGTITGAVSPIQGAFSVADPRHSGPDKFNDQYRVLPWAGPSGTVTSNGGKGQCISDPRPDNKRQFDNIYRVVRWDRTAGTVIGATGTADGALSVADPRASDGRRSRSTYLTAGMSGVVAWEQTSYAVSAYGQHDNGYWSVADPRPLPALTDRIVARIIAEDGTFHRPFTTLELAGLQSLLDPEEYLALDGMSDQAWRERIGNAVPPDAARAVAETMGRTLLAAWRGEGFKLAAQPIWVAPMAIAVSVKMEGEAG